MTSPCHGANLAKTGKNEVKMVKVPKIIEDPTAYGSKRSAWHPEFVKYMVSMVKDATFADMPDAVKDDGKIQWEAPSNRPPGKYQNTHHKRRDWWRIKAETIGVNPNADQWISTVAKRIHPTGEKPCKRCGNIMRIAYCYPNGHLISRLIRKYGDDFQVDQLEPVDALVQRIVDTYGKKELRTLTTLFAVNGMDVPDHGDNIDDWLIWLENEYIPSEPSLLSPGAMSNAPDRFDGFHSFNLCCRKKADTGRHEANMKSYTTDRRVFEYWSEGNWIAADRLMGLVRAKFSKYPSADGGEGPSSADHIGPLSLGFMHRPEFRLLSKAANSAKNNRMSLWDVKHLIRQEEIGVCVVSWHAQHIWNLRKNDVTTEEMALRLSKIMRDNQRNIIHILGTLYAKGHFAFLTRFLGLECAESNIEFVNLYIDDYITKFDEIKTTQRTTKYTREQKARRIRVAFETLSSYLSKDNRHQYVVQSSEIKSHIDSALTRLDNCSRNTKELNNELRKLLEAVDKKEAEKELRIITSKLPPANEDAFDDALFHIIAAIKKIAVVLNSMWTGDRYVREQFNFDD